MKELWVIERKESHGDWEFFTAYITEKDADDHLLYVLYIGSATATFRKRRFVAEQEGKLRG
jgi:hypothetical protein